MRVGIVGAGITGLALHHFLRERGVESIVFEARDEPGGVVRTVEQDRHVLNLGPQRTRLTPGIRELIDVTGLERDVVEATDGPLYVYHDGALRRAPLSVRAAVETDLLSFRGKLRALFEPFAGPPREGESVAGYLERAFGREVAERVGGPLYAGLYASDPAEMPVEYSLVKALDHLGVDRSVLLTALSKRLRGRSAPPAVSFTEGLAGLPRALYRTYATDVQLNAPVTNIEDSDTGNGYELDVDGSTQAVDRVVLTVPAGRAAALLADLDPESADALDALTYNPIAVVHLHAETTLDGSGHQVAPGEDLLTRGVTWNDSLLNRDGVYTCYLGGATRPDVVNWDDSRLANIAVSEFEQVTGATADPLAVNRITPGMPAYDRSWEELDGLETPPGVTLCANYESRAGIPGRVRQAQALADRVRSV